MRRGLLLTGARAARAGSWDVSVYGLPYGLAIGPYGALLALTWQRNMGGDTYLIQLDRQRPGEWRAAPRPRIACQLQHSRLLSGSEDEQGAMAAVRQ